MKKVGLFRVLFVCLICLILTSLVLVACSTPASTGAPKVLRFASFDAPQGFTSNAHQVFADELEKRTGGRYKVEIAWGGAMGKTEEHYELVRDGIADIGYFLTALSPGVFPMSDIISLPWVLPSSAESVPAFWEFYKQGHLDKELSKVKPIFVWTGPGNVIFSSKTVNSLADLKGRKLISHSEINNKVITNALNGVPVFIPHGEMYGAVQKGTVDGLYFVWCGIAPFNLQEVVHYAVEPAFGNIGCVVAMNTDSYNKLPKDVQNTINKMTEEILLPLTISGYQDAEDISRKAFAETGGKISNWSSADAAQIASAVKPMWSEWISATAAKGLSAEKACSDLYSILRKQGLDAPAIGYTP